MEQAVRLSGVAVSVQWRPFLLNKDTPPEGYDLKSYLRAKYGEQVVARFDRSDNPLDAAGYKVGISFNKSRRIINSMDCHQLMEWCYANCPEKADSLMESMFHAYFEEAKDLSNRDVLSSITSKIGLDAEAIKQVLNSNLYRVNVLNAERTAKDQLRVSGVPFFIVEPHNGGRPTAFSGAQPAEVIAEVLEEAKG